MACHNVFKFNEYHLLYACDTGVEAPIKARDLQAASSHACID